MEREGSVTQVRSSATTGKGARAAPIPRRALLISLLALVGPIAAVAMFPVGTSNSYGMLVWLSALIPAFLLSYYRGLRGVAIALSGGMAVITATQVSVVVFEIAEPDWTLLLIIVGVYLGVSVGIAALAELLRRERTMAEDLALVDRLTNLANRRHLDVALEMAFAAAERGQPLAVAMFDLDRFKRVNDTFGHSAGDEALRQFAEVLRTCTRRENLAARFGGEEFAAILQGEDGPGAVVFAERVVTEMRAKTSPWGKQTVSAGVAVHQPGMGSFELLLGAADRALYRAKAEGRDRVCLAPVMSESAKAAAPVATAAETVAPPTAGEPKPRRGRVYLVDDLAEVRSVLYEVLTEEGYEVWDSGEPKEVVRHFAETAGADRPDLIVTDVIMPEMTGMTMIDHIVAIDPTVRVVYMSGYVHSPVEWEGLPGAAVSFLHKPIAVDALLTAVDELIHRSAEPLSPPAVGS